MSKFNQSWRLSETRVTPEAKFYNRRALIRGLGLGGAASALGLGMPAIARAEFPASDLYPAPVNQSFATGDTQGLDFPITSEKTTSVYNNYYEFFNGVGTSKNIHRAAQKLKLDPWTVTIDGMVKEPKTWDIEALIRAMPLEERVYRHRCVEAWAMTVPWSGFALSNLIRLVQPLSSAKYIRFETFNDPEVAVGQRNTRYPWPYVEGLTIEEGMNDLAFMATGCYSKPLSKQMGAPLRLALPWKYGFKSGKGLARIHFTDEKPRSFWEDLNGREYGFWANVNPEVDHPRWSQANERDLGTGEQRPTLLFNGYAEQVAQLYTGMESLGDRLYR